MHSLIPSGARPDTLSTPFFTVQDLVNAAPDALLVADSAGVILLVNPRAERLLGYARDELVGASVGILIARDRRATQLDLLADAVESLPDQPNNRFEIVVRHKSGAEVLVDVSLSALEFGERKVIVAALRDVGFRLDVTHALDRERLARARAEAAVQLRDSFLATVTHDLKQPLTTIRAGIGLIEELALEVGDHPSAEHIRSGSRRIESASIRMAGQLEELLDVTRMQLGQPLTLRRSPMDLGRTMRAAVDEQHESDRARIRLQLPATPVTGMWDPERLERIVYNLLGNALKYSPDGGSVTMAVRVESGFAILEVSDEGIGIPSADVGHVFEWFYRGSNVASVAAGAGLGLAGVREIVERHGGSIDVHSVPGLGSTFTVRLPTEQTQGFDSIAAESRVEA